MSWLFGMGGGGQKPPIETPPPPGPKDEAPTEKTGHESRYSFDSTALERAAKAAKELEKSKNSVQALELSRLQESTKQKEHEATVKQMEVQMEQIKLEQVRIQHEEQRKTNQEQAKIKQSMVEYEDQLARKRFNDQSAQQNRAHEENLKRQEESVAKQEAIRRGTIEEEAQIRHKYEMLRVQKELEGKGKLERDNHDLRMEKIRLQNLEKKDLILKSISTVASVLGEGFKYFISDFNQVLLTAGALGSLAGSVYIAKHGVGVTARFVEARLGKPSLIRETSRQTASEWVKHPVRSFQQRLSKPSDVLKGIVLRPELEERLREIAVSTKNTKVNNGYHRNVLFYGPPGTGKTMFAKALAASSNMDYAVMTGGDVAPLGKDGVSSIHRVFEWARTSRNGLILFIDEADAFLRKRSKESISEDVRATLNAFLHHTGTHSKHFMLVLASNQPEQFDWAVNDRIDEMVFFSLPDAAERERLFRLYFEKFILRVAMTGLTNDETGLDKFLPAFMKKQSRLKLADDVDYDDVITKIATQTDGFSGREISKVAIAWQASAYASEDGKLSREIMEARLKDALHAHKHKELWQRYTVGQDTDSFFIKDDESESKNHAPVDKRSKNPEKET